MKLRQARISKLTALVSIALIVGCGGSDPQDSTNPSVEPIANQQGSMPSASEPRPVDVNTSAPDDPSCVGELAPKKNPVRPIGSDEYLRVQACMAYMANIESLVGLHNLGRLDEGELGYERGSLDYYIWDRIISRVRAGDSADSIERSLFCDCLAQPLDAFWDADIAHPGVGPKVVE